MQNRTILMTLAALTVAACDGPTDPTPGGSVSIAIQQVLTGQTSSTGTFTLTGVLSDDGGTTEELTFGGPLTAPTVPVTFRRELTGKRGTMTITGSAVQFGSASVLGCSQNGD